MLRARTEESIKEARMMFHIAEQILGGAIEGHDLLTFYVKSFKFLSRVFTARQTLILKQNGLDFLQSNGFNKVRTMPYGSTYVVSVLVFLRTLAKLP